MTGFIILDKPQGITSFKACEFVKNKLGARKAGHAGTLDPNVTGVLVIALNSSTKLMPLLNKLDKEYEGIAHLHRDIPLKKIQQTIKKHFLGKIKQIPPRKSRVKRLLPAQPFFVLSALQESARPPSVVRLLGLWVANSSRCH